MSERQTGTLAAVARYIANRPNQIIFLDDITTVVHAERKAIQNALSHMVRDQRLPGLETRIQGNCWLYNPPAINGSEPDKFPPTLPPVHKTRRSSSPMKEGIDYIVEDKTPEYSFEHPRQPGKWVKNSGVIRVYLAATNDMAWMCKEGDYVHENPRSVFAHRSMHRVPTTAEQKAAAFDLLPEAIKKKLLAQLKEEKTS